MNSIVPSSNRQGGMANFHDTGNQKILEEQKRKLQEEKQKNEKMQREIDNMKQNAE